MVAWWAVGYLVVFTMGLLVFFFRGGGGFGSSGILVGRRHWWCGRHGDYCLFGC